MSILFKSVRDVGGAGSRGRLRVVGVLLTLLVAAVVAVVPASVGSASTPEGIVKSFGGEGVEGGEFSTPGQIAVNEGSGDIYVADTKNDRVQEFGPEGEFIRAWGEGVLATGTGKADAEQSVRVQATGGDFTLTFGGDKTVEIPWDAAAATVQSDLQALASVGSGNVTVSGGPGDELGTKPYVAKFVGTLAEKPQTLMTVASGTLSPLSGGKKEVTDATINPGETGFDICETAADCKAGVAAATGGGMKEPNGIAVNQQSGDVYVYDKGYARVDEFSASGGFIRAWGDDVVSSGPGKSDSQQSVWAEATGGTFTLTFGGDTTGPIAFNASAATVQSALEALASVGAGDVEVAGGVVGNETGTTPHVVTRPYVVTFVGKLGEVAQTNMTATGTSLTGGAGTVTVAKMHTGATGFDICEASRGDLCVTGESISDDAKLGGGFGLLGSGGLAVAPGSGDVYVADSGNKRVEEFGPEGAFILAFGEEVVEKGGPDRLGLNRTGAASLYFEVCVNANGDTCKAGESGTGAGEFGFGTGSPTYLAVDAAGVLFATDTGNSRVLEFTPGATPAALSASEFAEKSKRLAGTPKASALAVEPNAEGERLLAVKENATPESLVDELLLEGPFVGLHYVGDDLPGTAGIAYDAKNGRVYYSSASGAATGKAVMILSFTPGVVRKPTVSGVQAGGVGAHAATFQASVDPEGNETTYRFEYSTNGTSWTGVPAQEVLVGEGEAGVPVTQSVEGLSGNTLYLLRVVARNAAGVTTSSPVAFTTSELPPEVSQVLASPTQTGAVLSAYVNPENAPTSYRFQYGPTAAYGSEAPGFEREIGAGSQPVRVSEQISGLQPGTLYHFRIVAKNTNTPGVTEGRDATFTTLSSGEGPGGCPNEQVRGESDLNPATGGPLSMQLPECRGYEMVTPEYKNGATMSTKASQFAESGGLVSRVSPDGEAVLVESTGTWAALEGEQPPNNLDLKTSSKEAVRYRVVRGASGWRYTPVDPAATELHEVEPYVSPAPDSLDLGGIWYGSGFSPGEGSASSGLAGHYATEDNSFYRLEPNGTSSLIGPATPLSAFETQIAQIENDANTKFYQPQDPISGASQDLSHLLFVNEGERWGYWPFDSTHVNTELAAATIPSLYEYVGINHTGEGSDVPTLVGVNNEGRQITQCGTYEGAEGAEDKGTEPEAYLRRDAMSANGATVFFTAVSATGNAGGTACTVAAPGAGPVATLVLARIGEPGPGLEVGGPGEKFDTTTVNVAAEGSGSSRECSSDECGVTLPVTYQGASVDGSRVFFTTKQQLSTVDKDTENNIWECRLPGDSGAVPARSGKVNPCPELVPVSVSGTGSGADVQSVVAISEDGSHVYFIGTGVLGGENAEGKAPVAGKDNLYMWEEPTAAHPDGHTAFIATLPSGTLEEAQTTPNGQSLVFTSTGDLTSDDTSTVAQAFLYEAQSETLLRISHGQDGYNDDGNTTSSPATLAGGGQNNGGENNDRYEAGFLRKTISDDGSYVVFQSSAALTSQVQPGAVDNVYEYHDGNVSLLSDGLPPSAASRPGRTGLIGIDSTGENVFFVTSRALVGQDGDELEDLYDARIDGGFKRPVVTGCAGEACQGAPPVAPLVSSLGSTFPTGGNGTPSKTVEKPSSAKVTKALTAAQKLARALKACRAERVKRKRAKCEAQARKRYKVKKTKKKVKPKARGNAKKAGVMRASGKGGL